jgi:hypothetical protein
MIKMIFRPTGAFQPLKYPVLDNPESFSGKEILMSNHSVPRSPFFRRLPRKNYAGLWKPVAVTGVGGTAITLWLDEIVMFAEEILGLIFLFIMAGLIYLLDILMFKSVMPKKEK